MDDKLFIRFEGDIFVEFLGLISNPILLHNTMDGNITEK